MMYGDSVRDTKIGVHATGIGKRFGEAGHLKEVWYQFAEPWLTDSQHTAATFGLTATPLPDAARATVDWWRARGAE